jgi:hypothetical protein
VSDIDTAAVVNGLKVLDPKRPIREADIRLRRSERRFGPTTDVSKRSKVIHCSITSSAMASK